MKRGTSGEKIQQPDERTPSWYERCREKGSFPYLSIYTAGLCVFVYYGYYAAVPLYVLRTSGSLGASGFLPGRRLEYTVESEGRSEKEKPLVFFVTVKNSGVLPVFSVSITVVLRNKFTEEERRERIITAVGPRAKKTVKVMTEEKHCRLRRSLHRRSVHFRPPGDIRKKENLDGLRQYRYTSLRKSGGSRQPNIQQFQFGKF